MPFSLRQAASLVTALLIVSCTSMSPNTPGRDSASPQSVMDELLAVDRAYSAASAKTDLVFGVSAMFASDVAMSIPGGKFSAAAATRSCSVPRGIGKTSASAAFTKAPTKSSNSKSPPASSARTTLRFANLEMSAYTTPITLLRLPSSDD